MGAGEGGDGGACGEYRGVQRGGVDDRVGEDVVGIEVVEEPGVGWERATEGLCIVGSSVG